MVMGLPLTTKCDLHRPATKGRLIIYFSLLSLGRVVFVESNVVINCGFAFYHHENLCRGLFGILKTSLSPKRSSEIVRTIS